VRWNKILKRALDGSRPEWPRIKRLARKQRALLFFEDESMVRLIRPNVGFEPESYRLSAFAAYYRVVKRALQDAVKAGSSQTYPEPVGTDAPRRAQSRIPRKAPTWLNSNKGTKCDMGFAPHRPSRARSSVKLPIPSRKESLAPNCGGGQSAGTDYALRSHRLHIRRTEKRKNH
jgi:hypothetical protein